MKRTGTADSGSFLLVLCRATENFDKKKFYLTNYAAVAIIAVV